MIQHLDRLVWANSVDPDRTAPGGAVWSDCSWRSSLIRVYTVWHSVCIFWTHYCMVQPHGSNFRIMMVIFCVSQFFLFELPHDKTNKVTVRPAKTQISLGIHPVWSESSLCAQRVAKDPSFFHADSEDSDQTGRMPRLIWVFAGSTQSFCWFCHEAAHFSGTLSSQVNIKMHLNILSPTTISLVRIKRQAGWRLMTSHITQTRAYTWPEYTQSWGIWRRTRV